MRGHRKINYDTLLWSKKKIITKIRGVKVKVNWIWIHFKVTADITF